jgi:Rieske Fe-S protein
MNRREFVKGAAILAVGAAAGAGITLGLHAVGGPDAPRSSPIVLRGVGEAAEETTPVRLSDLAGPAPVFIGGEWRLTPALLVKVRVATLAASSRMRDYNTGQHGVQHPTEPEHAIVAYDARCTHLGCTVGWLGQLGGSKDVADYDGDGARDGRTLCPCHQSQFDVYDLGRDQQPGPAKRPLPVIRVRLVPIDGTADAELWGTESLYQEAYRDADGQGDGAGFKMAP